MRVKRTLMTLLPCLAALCVLTACGGSVTQGSGAASGETSAPVTGRSDFDIGEVVSELDANPVRAVRRSIEPIRQTLITRFDGTSVPEDFYLYRNTLSERYQDAYDQVCQALMERRRSIALSVSVPKEDFQYVYHTVLSDHPEIFWVTTSCSYFHNNQDLLTEIQPQYWDIDVDAWREEMEQSVSEALADMWGLGSDVEKAKYAHDYLTHTITYAHNDMDQNAYSGFVWKQTVCAGYAKCFSYMMHKMGIPCASVIGVAGGPHAWNILELNGELYMMDVTWDDSDANPDAYSYKYFNITDERISSDHTRGMTGLTISTSLPYANGTAMSYENAFDGDAYGTDFDAIEGVWPNEYDDDDDYDDDDYDDDDDDDDYYYDGEWWKWLDDSWEIDDWEYDGEGLWHIYDDETEFIYIYDEGSGIFGACSEDDMDTIYWLDPETGEWELYE